MRLLPLLLPLLLATTAQANEPVFRMELKGSIHFSGIADEEDENEVEQPVERSIVLTPATLPSGVVGTPWSHDFASNAALVGVTPNEVTWSIDSLPPGLSFSSLSVLSGTPEVADDYGVSISAQSGTAGDSETYTIVIDGRIYTASSLAGGFNFTCALIEGRVTCWGANAHGQLGLGDNTARTSPGEFIAGLSGVTAIYAGSDFACARSPVGVQCWGNNANGKLGYGDTSSRSAPGPAIGTLASSVDLHLGINHACASFSAGVRCWGNNNQSQLGYGHSNDVTAPGALLSVAATKMALLVDGTCVLASGQVRCWGNNTNGQLGYGDTSTRSSPAGVIPGLTGVQDIGAGWSHACASTASNVRCWGNNRYGNVTGTAENAFRTTPQTVAGLGSVSQLHVGRYFNCVIASGAVRCWGASTLGVIGVEQDAVLAPGNAIDGLGTASSILPMKYAYYGCATTGDGIKCWGDNRYNAVSDASATVVTTPALREFVF